MKRQTPPEVGSKTALLRELVLFVLEKWIKTPQKSDELVPKIAICLKGVTFFKPFMLGIHVSSRGCDVCWKLRSPGYKGPEGGVVLEGPLQGFLWGIFNV